MEELVRLLRMAADVYAGLLLLRAWLEKLHFLGYENPARFVFILTNPALRVFPFVRNRGQAALLAAFALAALLIGTLLFTAYPILGSPGNVFLGILFLALARLSVIALELAMGVVILGAILSWINPQAPVAPLVFRVTEPLLAPFRRLLPPAGGLDFSSALFLLLAYFILLPLIGRVSSWGLTLALS
mgnify:CR=1 FL=1